MNRPNKAEIELLNLAYNRFYDLYAEIIDDDFWKNEDWKKLSKITQIFSIYTEILNYEPIKYVIKYIKENHPPME